jgi:hypothetical protein
MLALAKSAWQTPTLTTVIQVNSQRSRKTQIPLLHLNLRRRNRSCSRSGAENQYLRNRRREQERADAAAATHANRRTPRVPTPRGVETGPRAGRRGFPRPGGHPAGGGLARAGCSRPGAHPVAGPLARPARRGGRRPLLPARPVPGPPQVGGRRQHQPLEARLLPPWVAGLSRPQLPPPGQPMLRHPPRSQLLPPRGGRRRRPRRLPQRLLRVHRHRPSARRRRTVRPPGAVLVDGAKVKRLPPSLSAVNRAVVWPPGQVTVFCSRSITKARLGNRPPLSLSCGTFATNSRAAAANACRVAPPP